jgi:hypothetical protein
MEGMIRTLRKSAKIDAYGWSRFFVKWLFLIGVISGCSSVGAVSGTSQRLDAGFGAPCRATSQCSLGYSCVIGVCVDGFNRH